MPVDADIALQNGKLVEAIKLFREKHDIGLKDAKEAVEKYLEQNLVTRKRFKNTSARERKRVITIVFMLLGLLMVGYFFVTRKISLFTPKWLF
jgi:hypothetical protein